MSESATLSMAKTKATSKTKTNAVDTAEVLPVKVWDPKWENSNKKPTKIATTISNVSLTQHGAKKRMRCFENVDVLVLIKKRGSVTMPRFFVFLNSDQIIEEDLFKINNYWIENNSDVGVVTFTSVHPRWSYILNDGKEIIQTAEKNPISNKAIAGYYYFKSAELFFDCSFKTILNDVQIDGLFFVSPVINEYVLKNKKVNFYEIENKQYHSFYSPKLITEFELNYNGTRKI